MIRIQNILLACLLLVAVACYSAQSESPDMVNSTCPIGDDPVTADSETVEWNGKTVGFCCGKCVPEWDGLDDAAKAAALEAAK